MEREALCGFIKSTAKSGDLVTGLTKADPVDENPVVAMYVVEPQTTGEVPDYFLAAADRIRTVKIERPQRQA